MNTDPLIPNQELRMLLRWIRWERNYHLVMAAILFAFSLLFCMCMGISGRGVAIMMGILTMTLILVGFKLVHEAVKAGNGTQSELYRIVDERPTDIVWVYSTDTHSAPYGVLVFRTGTLYFKLLDGESLSLKVPVRHLKKLSESLNTRLSHATFGHSAEREQWYLAEPALLYQDHFNSEKKD